MWCNILCKFWGCFCNCLSGVLCGERKQAGRAHPSGEGSRTHLRHGAHERLEWWEAARCFILPNHPWCYISLKSPCCAFSDINFDVACNIQELFVNVILCVCEVSKINGVKFSYLHTLLYIQCFFFPLHFFRKPLFLLQSYFLSSSESQFSACLLARCLLVRIMQRADICILFEYSSEYLVCNRYYKRWRLDCVYWYLFCCIKPWKIWMGFQGCINFRIKWIWNTMNK